MKNLFVYSDKTMDCLGHSPISYATGMKKQTIWERRKSAPATKLMFFFKKKTGFGSRLVFCKATIEPKYPIPAEHSVVRQSGVFPTGIIFA